MNPMICFRAVITVFVMACCFLSLESPVFAERLILQVKQDNNTLNVHARFALETVDYTLEYHMQPIRKLKEVYAMMEPPQEKKGIGHTVSDFVESQLKTIGKVIKGSDGKSEQDKKSEKEKEEQQMVALLEAVGSALFNPVEPYIEAASAIEFVITKALIYYPFDALYFNGESLYLTKPVIFSFSTKPDAPLTVSGDWKGMMVSDARQDPDRGVLKVKSVFPKSVYFEGEKITENHIQNVNKRDFILISARSGIEGVELPKTIIRSTSLSHIQPKLAYFDSSKMGLRWDFVQSFQQAGTRYFIAPVLSNEVGNASTRTTERFFRVLQSGETPWTALFLVRKTLFDEYTIKGDDLKTVMWRSFPFRLYHLN